MFENILYLLVSLIATIIGAMTGIGGGIVLKSLVDFFSNDPVVVVSCYTTVIVFTMCIVSIYKQWKKGFKFDLKMLIGISIGSLIGGYLGDVILNNVIILFKQQQVQLVQSVMLFFTLIFLIIYSNIGPKKEKIQHISITKTMILGVFLGTISIFLAIGGGPLNVSLLIILFGYSMKEAAIYSIATVFSSQIAKIISIVSIGNYNGIDVNLIPFLIIVAIIGGYLGTSLNQKLGNKKIEQLYTTLMICLIVITVVNILKFW